MYLLLSYALSPLSCIKYKTKYVHTEAPHLQKPPNMYNILLPGF
jgi:hypothetical protein